MNLLIVHETCGYFGGVEQNVVLTVRALRKRGVRCVLCYGREGRSAASYAAEFDGVRLCREMAAQPVGDGSDAFSRIAQAESPRAIYIHKTPDTSWLLPFAGKTRLVRMVHDHDLCCPRRHKYFALSGRVCSRRAGLRCWLDAAFLGKNARGRVGYVSVPKHIKEMRRNRRMDLLLVGSRSMRDELLVNGFAESRVRVLPPVVPEPTTGMTAVPEPGRVLFVGQLIRGKGVDQLLRAVALIDASWHLDVVGEGNARPSLEDLALSLGISDRVAFHGWVDNMSVGDFYGRCAVVAVPSRWPEPFGMTGLEAMHRGRPVVAFDVGGIPDWLTDGVTGVLAPEGDVGALAKGIERLLADPGSACKMGDSGRKRAREDFDFGRFIDALVLDLFPKGEQG